MPSCDENFAKEFVYRLAECSCSKQRWGAFKDTLGDLGASAVIAAKVEASTGVIDWMQSSLPQSVVSDYLSEGYVKNDLLARHAATCTQDLVWRPRDGWKSEEEADGAGFAGFVADSGFQSVVCSSASDTVGTSRYAVTFCSEHGEDTVLRGEIKEKILQSCKGFLPWLRWQDITTATDIIHANRRALSPRERDVLCYLAVGLQNGQIAETLGISDAMVSRHLLHARQKLGALTASHAVALAIRYRQINL